MAIVDARVIVVWAMGGVDMVNTALCRYDDATVDAQGAADTIRDAFQNHMMDTVSDEQVLQEVKVGDDINGATALSGQSGLVVGSALNIGQAYGITKIVGSGRNGRWFLPGLDEGNVDESGRVLPSVVNAVNGALADLLTEINAGGVDLLVEQKAPAPPAVVTQLSTRQFVTVQTRRLDRARGF